MRSLPSADTGASQTMSSEARETLGASKPTRPELDQGQDLGKRLPGASSIDDFFEQSRAARLAEGPRTPGAGSGSDPRDTIGILQENRRINLGARPSRSGDVMVDG